MNQVNCAKERISSRTLGLILLPVGLLLVLAGFLLLPVLGFFFAIPILILSGLLLAAPQSRVCKLITGKGA